MRKTIAFVSSLLMLVTLLAASMPVLAASHTFEETRPPEWYESYIETVQDQWYMDEDGVIYCAEDGSGSNFEEYIPNPGTFDRSELLLALMYKYPDSQFAVQLDSWSEDDSEETRALEEAYIRENGIDFTSAAQAQNRVYKTKYAILTVEQLENFPVYEKVGYLIGLAKKSDISLTAEEPSTGDSINTLAGDINADNEIGVVDIVCLKKYLLNSAELDAAQWAAADINQDNNVDGFDLAILKRILLKK